MFPLLIWGFWNFRFPFDSRFWAKWLEVACFVVAFTGLGIRALVVGYAPAGTSGRITSGQKASQLNTTGAYSLCRHPLYLGNFLIGLGFMLFLQSFNLLLLYSLLFLLYYERIMLREETFLAGKFGGDYPAWAARTPAFIPRFGNWSRPGLPFSFRNVLRREYTAFFLIILVMTAFEIVGNSIVEGRLVFETEWRWLFGFGFFVYLALMLLKKKTRLLHVPGR